MLKMQALLRNGDQHVGAHRNPDLRLHGVLGCAVERLDPKMLLNPLEEEFNLPATTVDLGNGQRRKLKMIGKEHQTMPGFGVDVFNASESVGIALGGVEPNQLDGLIAD